MASSSSTGSVNRRAREGIRSRCDCGDLVGMWTSWTTTNPACRFVGCPNYKYEEHDCGYFGWIDPSLPNNWYREQMFAVHNRLDAQNVQVEVAVGGVEAAVGGVGLKHGNWKKAVAFGVVLGIVISMFGRMLY